MPVCPWSPTTSPACSPPARTAPSPPSAATVARSCRWSTTPSYPAADGRPHHPGLHRRRPGEGREPPPRPAGLLAGHDESGWSYAVLEGDASSSHRWPPPPTTRPWRSWSGSTGTIRGEHPDWADYRPAMVADRRLVARLVVDHAYGHGPFLTAAAAAWGRPPRRRRHRPRLARVMTEATALAPHRSPVPIAGRGPRGARPRAARGREPARSARCASWPAPARARPAPSPTASPTASTPAPTSPSGCSR